MEKISYKYRQFATMPNIATNSAIIIISTFEPKKTKFPANDIDFGVIYLLYNKCNIWDYSSMIATLSLSPDIFDKSGKHKSISMPKA